jgi:DNA-binding transcriptional MerR regulator
MLKIGDFSRLGRVTIKTLRYWDEIGLLKPDYVNMENGYRYYASDKLAVVQEIMSMKDIGLYLEDIHKVLQGGLHKSQWLELLLSRKSSLIEEIQLYEKKLQKLDQMLALVEKESYMDKIEIRELPEVIVASMRTTIPDYQALFSVVPPMGDIMRKQGAVCREPAYCFNIYHDGEYREKDIDVEICEAVVDFCKDGEGVIYKKLPFIKQAAVIMHTGPYETLGKSYASIISWIEENEYEIVDNPRESYIDGVWNRQNPEEWRTEIQIPIIKK